ncbi:MAG: hypothetical protein PSX81_15470 [bacterium]|nr:hypothetical protein [bacterium]
MSETVDILNFEFSTRGIRDIGIVEPSLSYLELKYKLKVKRECISDNFCQLIKKYNPRLIVTSNGIGTVNHHEMVKYASMKGIKVITFISEGDMVDIKENVEILFWGNNKDQIFYEYANLQWSEKNIQLILKHIPEAKNFNLFCAGGTGFDRYQFLPLKTKNDFYSQYPQYKKYKKIIGLAGFPFYFFLSDLYKKDGQWNNMHLDHDACDTMAAQKEPLRLMYHELVKNNPDTLFILKYHPSDIMQELSEFYQLNQFENTLSIFREENIDDVINISDLWVGFESTTCLEAWLLGKTTFIANPDNVPFIRSIISSGSPHYGNFETLNSAISNFFETNNSVDFDNLKAERENAIAQVIGFGDGLNHKRAGDFIFESLDKTGKKIIVDSAFLTGIEKKYANIEFRKKLRSIIYKTPLIWLPKVRNEFLKDQQKANEFIAEKRESFANLYQQSLIEFYKKNNILLD